ncbi:hypothetical protein TGMAS_416960 [Toxoplasma gondii MAS]|uniref:Uncharacterized protein n=1 Tax=Toxoplasma gondii MAS TaxID=943118 RepID=A0A086PQ99_TOXGO|nr:hypothetical protein TGMAS_416960 [Toxoplasma gondii MAS]
MTRSKRQSRKERSHEGESPKEKETSTHRGSRQPFDLASFFACCWAVLAFSLESSPHCPLLSPRFTSGSRQCSASLCDSQFSAVFCMRRSWFHKENFHESGPGATLIPENCIASHETRGRCFSVRCMHSPLSSPQ